MDKMKEQPLGSSWGLTGQRNCDHRHLRWRTEKLPNIEPGKTLLPVGNNRSYGDSCLNNDAISLDTRSLNHFISFDSKSHILRCEVGTMLAEILQYFVPEGWMLPVTPSTKYVTVGGAIGNDVHGTNHHRRGSFGNHVVRIALRRSSGQIIICSRTENEKIFYATIGGLGLTGIIIWADIMLMQIDGNCIKVKTSRFNSIEQFLEIANDARWKYEYISGWLDCSQKPTRGRGVLKRANHSNEKKQGYDGVKSGMNLPNSMPDYLVNNLTSKLASQTYYYYHYLNRKEQLQSIDKFLYSMDRIKNWNRLYGKKGLLQYHCVLPIENGDKWLGAILREVTDSGIISPLAGLKIFGDLEAKGILSFPRRGVSLSMDFPNNGSSVLGLFDCLDSIVADARGAVYPAKDARMSARNFKLFFPRLDEFKKQVDPHFSSTFWRRVSV